MSTSERDRPSNETANSFTSTFTVGGGDTLMIPLGEGCSYAGIEGPRWVFLKKGEPPRKVEFSELDRSREPENG